MFGIGMPELLLVLGLALIVIGPQKMPAVAKALGRGLNEFRRATQEIKNTIDVSSYMEQSDETHSASNTDSSTQSSVKTDVS
ncbi:MAG: twin-arginine translocase TatA/TatE family subunit [Deltaproteobacteria bacterium]|jgi:TatA/E family protein of Tat protein translocase|nr:twin-arginine translocase TatA/TatE family subunit [Deltaproteobacteria bacterium]